MLQSSFLLPCRVLRAILAKGMDPACVVTAPRFPSCWGLRCNEFVRSAAGQPPARQAAAAPLRTAISEGLDNTSRVSEISPHPWCPQLHPCGERPSSLEGTAPRVPPERLGELGCWGQPPREQQAEIAAVITAPTNLSPGKGSDSGSSALRAEGHTCFYSQAKEKKEAILFT